MRIVILHGSGSHPQSHWLAWLQEVLRKQSVEVIAPWFPSPEGQHLDSWIELFESEIGAFRASDIVVSHDIGLLLVLRVLERHRDKVSLKDPSPPAIAGLLAVASYYKNLGIPEFDVYGSSFYYGEPDWPYLRSVISHGHILHGSNDPYVPREQAQYIADKLALEFREIENAMHFDNESDPMLVESAIKVSFNSLISE